MRNALKLGSGRKEILTECPGCSLLIHCDRLALESADTYLRTYRKCSTVLLLFLKPPPRNEARRADQKADVRSSLPNVRCSCRAPLFIASRRSTLGTAHGPKALRGRGGSAEKKFSCIFFRDCPAKLRKKTLLIYWASNTV